MVCGHDLPFVISTGRKDELIAALVRSDEVLAMASSQESVPRDPSQPTSTEPPLSGEDLRELATIVDEMKHLRRQWLLQVPRQGQGFVHQGYGLSTARKA